MRIKLRTQACRADHQSSTGQDGSGCGMGEMEQVCGGRVEQGESAVSATLEGERVERV